MKPEIPNQNDESLRQALCEWKVDAPLPPRFNEQVWRRIAAEETPAINPVTFVVKWITQLVAQPKFAFAYAAILLAAGLMAGYWQANATVHRTESALGTQYIQLVDPYQMPRH